MKIKIFGLALCFLYLLPPGRHHYFLECVYLTILAAIILENNDEK
jgi:hypothetical protein